MSQHKPSLGTAMALLCRGKPNSKGQRPFKLSRASDFQVPVADFSSDVSLSAFSLTATLNL